MKNIKLKLGLAVLGLTAVLGIGVTVVHPGAAEAAGFRACAKSVDSPEAPGAGCFGDGPRPARLEEW